MIHEQEVIKDIYDILSESQLGIRMCFVACQDALGGGCHCKNNRVFSQFHGQNAYTVVGKFLEHGELTASYKTQVKMAIREMLADALADANKKDGNV